MEWTDIRLTVAKADADNAEAVATMIAEGGIYIEDYSDIEQQVAEIAHVDLIEQELLDKPRDTVIIHMYLEPGASPVETLALIQARMEAAGITYTVETEGVEQEDWQNGWRKYYHPLDIGKRLAIVPSWQEYDTDRVKLILDPGLAFGTGGHETTSLCLEALDERVRGGERVLDIGTGSGILAIAALKLGRAHRRRECRPERRGRQADRSGGRPVRQGQRQVQYHHRQHRGKRHHQPCPRRARPDGRKRHLYCQRHHRQPQGRGDRRSGSRWPDRAGSEGEARLGVHRLQKSVITEAFMISFSWLALSVTFGATSPQGRGLGKKMKFAWTAKGSHFGGAGFAKQRLRGRGRLRRTLCLTVILQPKSPMAPPPCGGPMPIIFPA